MDGTGRKDTHCLGVPLASSSSSSPCELHLPFTISFYTSTKINFIASIRHKQQLFKQKPRLKAPSDHFAHGLTDLLGRLTLTYLTLTRVKNNLENSVSRRVTIIGNRKNILTLPIVACPRWHRRVVRRHWKYSKIQFRISTIPPFRTQHPYLVFLCPLLWIKCLQFLRHVPHSLPRRGLKQVLSLSMAAHLP